MSRSVKRLQERIIYSNNMKKNLHPNSIANLTYREGRPHIFGTKKKTHTISVTEEGWNGITQAAKASGCSSISEFIELLGRGELKVSHEQQSA